MTTGEYAFSCWAPDLSVWSQWAKPVLFAEGSPGALSDTPGWRSIELGSAPPPAEQNALVVDLPGRLSAAWGLALAAAGYRPVPLFNAASSMSAIVDVVPIRRALFHWAPDLESMDLPRDAPPAFLLDARRMGEKAVAVPGRFDNRSILFPQDFPSARFLLSHRLRSVVIIRDAQASLENDLSHVLYRWQEGGLTIHAQSPGDGKPPQEIRVSKPSGYGALWYRLLALMGLRRNSAGGFGARVPMPSHGSGFG